MTYSSALAPLDKSFLVTNLGSYLRIAAACLATDHAMFFNQHSTDTISLLQPPGNSQTDRATSNDRVCKVGLLSCRG